jgi:hypothetical protein
LAYAAIVWQSCRFGYPPASAASGGHSGDLRAHDQWMGTCLQESSGLLDVPRLRDMWECFASWAW